MLVYMEARAHSSVHTGELTEAEILRDRGSIPAWHIFSICLIESLPLQRKLISEMAPVGQSKSAAGTSSRAWEALTPPLAEWILEAVSSMGFQRMTPVQSSTIPYFMKNSDVVVEVGILNAQHLPKIANLQWIIGSYWERKDLSVSHPSG